MTVEQRVKTVISEHLDVEISKIKSESHLVDDLDADSLDLVEILMALEEEFGIEVPDEDAEGRLTIKAITEYVTKITNQD